MANWVYELYDDYVDVAVGYSAYNSSFLVAATTALVDETEFALINSSASVVWKKRLPEILDRAVVKGCALTGDFYVALNDANTLLFWTLLKVQGSDGAILWQQQFEAADLGAKMYLGDMVLDDADNPIVVGSEIGLSSSNAWAVKVDKTTGATTATKRYPLGSSDEPLFRPGSAVFYGGAFNDLTILGRKNTTTALLYQLDGTDLTVNTSKTYDITATGASLDFNHLPTTARAGSYVFGCIGKHIINLTYDTHRLVLPEFKGVIATYGSEVVAASPLTNAESGMWRLPTSSGSLTGACTAGSWKLTVGSYHLTTNPKQLLTAGANVITALLDGDALGKGPVRVIAAPDTYDSGIAGTYLGATYASTPVLTPGSSSTLTSVAGSTTSAAGTFTTTTPTRTLPSSSAANDITSMVAPTTGTIAGTIPHVTSYFASVTEGTVTCPLPAMTGAFTAVIEGLNGGLAPVQALLTGMDGFSASLPAITAELDLIVPQNGTLTGALPKVTSAFTRAWPGGVEGALPHINAAMEAVVGASGGINAVLPKLDASLAGGTQSNAFVMPAVTASMQGSIGVVGTMSAILAKPTAALDGTAAVAGTVAGALARIQADVAAVAGIIGGIAGSTKPIRAEFDGAIGGAGTMLGALPAVTLSASGSAAVLGSLAPVLPSLLGQLTLSYTSTPVLVPGLSGLTGLTQVMNTNTAAVTLFENYAYNSFATFDNEALGAGPNGLYVLDDGDTDDGAVPINAAIVTGLLDFGSPQAKRMSDFYLAMRAAGDIRLTVGTDENTPYEYALEPRDVATLKQRRDLIGKGMRGRYWQFGMYNTDGCDFEFDAYNMLVVDMSRRI